MFHDKVNIEVFKLHDKSIEYTIRISDIDKCDFLYFDFETHTIVQDVLLL